MKNALKRCASITLAILLAVCGLPSSVAGTLADMCGAAITASADGTLLGEGTDTSPYQITSVDDWNEFADSVAAGIDYSGKYFELTNDITVTTMVGVNDHSTEVTESKPFAGIFDGYGHVLTVDINSTSTHGAAPFSCVKNAEIKNLIVEGSVNGGIHSAGLVGILDSSAGNSVSIQNVVVNTDVTDTSITVGETSGGYVGGIIGHARTATVTLTNCAFGGTLTASSCAGGLVGWGDAGSVNTPLTFTNCSFTGTLCDPRPASHHPVRLPGTVGANVTGGFYTNFYNNYSNPQGDGSNGFTNYTYTDISITPPTAKTELHYSGSAQALITAGSTSQGTMVYSIDVRKTYSSSIPTAAEAGDYSVWYKVTAGSNTVAVDHVDVTIDNKTAPTYTVPTGLTAEYGQTLSQVALPAADNGTWSWTDPTQSIGNAGPAANLTFKASFTPNDTESYYIDRNVDVTVSVPCSTHTIVWKNDNTVLETDENIEYGATPVYNGATPTKAEDDDNTYSFSGWEPAVTTVKGDTTYTASFASASKQPYYSDIAVFCPCEYNGLDLGYNQALAAEKGYTVAVDNLNKYSKNATSGSYAPNITLGYKTTTNRDNAIKEIVLRVSSVNDSPESLSYNGRTYYRCAYFWQCTDGNNNLHEYPRFNETHGDLDCTTGGKYVHLYYTKQTTANNHDAITAITADTNSTGGVVNTSGNVQSVETSNNKTSDYYLHTTVSDPAVNYIDTNGDTKTANAEPVTALTTTLLGGWYAVTENIVNNNRLTCSGNVNLILCDGATLTAHKGITVEGDNSLTIWQQTNGTGALTIDNCDSGFAGIGSGSSQTAGTITVNGGVINTHGGSNAAGIGGGSQSNASVITINDGIVNANGGVGIGSGTGSDSASGGNITINGGNIRAVGYENGIGSEEQNDSAFGDCNVTLNWTERTRENTSVYASSYFANINLGNAFYDKATTNVYAAGNYVTRNGSYSFATSEFNGKTLIPNVNGWSVLQQQINDAQRGDTIRLGGYNYTAAANDTPLTIPAGKTITIDLNGYTINRNLDAAAENGNAITNNGTLTLTGGGKITRANNNSSGGAILNNGTLTIENAELSGNSAERGGGVFNSSNATLTMNGGSIKNNTATNGSGGGISNLETVTINNGTISNNTASSNGGGINNDGILNLNGGTISNNTCTGNGAGIYNTSSGSMGISGLPVVADNKTSSNITSNTQLPGTLSYNKITVTDTLSPTARIGVTESSITLSINTPFTNGLNGKGSVQNFFSDSSDYLIRANGDGEAYLTAKHSITVTKAGSGSGTASTSATVAAEGDEITITASPDNSQCYLSEIKVDCTDVSGYSKTLDNDNPTFTMPDGNVTVTVTFVQYPVTYKDLNGAVQSVSDFTAVKSNTTTMSTGWYAVTDSVNNSNRITVNGNVNLILCDGATLTANRGITVEGNNSLTIWEQTNGTGRLTIDLSKNADAFQNAGIGGTYNNACGSVTINGGILNVIGVQGAGIGSGYYAGSNSGSITINGGSVMASAKISAGDEEGSAGIGGGMRSSSGSITINGGTVTATGGKYGSGIGSGGVGKDSSDSFYNVNSITITGGTITATGKNGGTGIGCGKKGRSGSITITGGVINAYADTGAFGIGAGASSTGGTMNIALGYTDDTKGAMSVTSSGYKGTVTFNNAFSDNGGNIYSAAAVADDTFKSATTTLIPYDGVGAHLEGYSLILGDDIGVNFYMTLGESIAADETAYMRFTLPNGSTKDVYVKTADGQNRDVASRSGDYYVFPCCVAAKEMTATITAQMYSGENRPVGKTYTYTVKDYADYILRNQSSYNTETVELVKAMLYYGACAQRLFEYNTGSYADADIGNYSDSVPDVCDEVAGKKNSVPVQTIGSGDSAVTLTYYGSSLVLRSKTVYKLYFTKSGNNTAALPTLRNGETEYPPISQTYDGRTYICYEITDISPQDIDADITLRFGTNAVFTVNIGEYANLTLTDNNATEAEKDTINALYNYSAKGKDYLENGGNS